MDTLLSKTKEELVAEIQKLRNQLDFYGTKSVPDHTSPQSSPKSRLNNSFSEDGQVQFLESGEDEFKGNIDQAPLGYFFSDTNGILQWVNETLVKMFHLNTKDEMLGKSLFSLVEMGNISNWQLIIHGIMNHDSQYLSGEFRREYPDQSISYFAYQTQPIYIERQEIGFVGFIFDITRIKSDCKNSYRNEILKEVNIESTKSVLIASLDRNYCYTFFNHGHAELVKRLYGTTPSLGKSIFEVITDKEIGKIVKSHYDRTLAGEGHVFTLQGTATPDESDFLAFEVTYTPIYNNNKEVIGLTLCAVDKTNLVLTQEALKHQQELAKENAEKANRVDITSEVLHNAGNILNSIFVSIDVLIDCLEKSSINNIVKVNQLIHENMDNLENFIVSDPKGKKALEYAIYMGNQADEEKNTMLSMGQRLTEKIDLLQEVISSQQSFAVGKDVIEEYSLESIINNALDIYNNKFLKNNVQVIKSFAKIPLVKVEKTKLTHIFLNLIKNALESMLHQPEDQRTLHLVIENHSQYVLCKCIDSGIGIHKEDMNKLFTHGFTTKQRGHGFGLSSSMKHIKKMGGEMYAESEGENRGASFVVKLGMNQL